MRWKDMEERPNKPGLYAVTYDNGNSYEEFEYKYGVWLFILPGPAKWTHLCHASSVSARARAYRDTAWMEEWDYRTVNDFGSYTGSSITVTNGTTVVCDSTTGQYDLEVLVNGSCCSDQDCQEGEVWVNGECVPV